MEIYFRLLFLSSIFLFYKSKNSPAISSQASSFPWGVMMKFSPPQTLLGRTWR
jgi:hypothetical protein